MEQPILDNASQAAETPLTPQQRLPMPCLPQISGFFEVSDRRLLEPIGNIPPAEAEANFYAALETEAMAA